MDNKKIEVVKALEEELKQATFIVMSPDEIDGHGDITSELEVRKACFNFNKFSRQANLFHITKTNTFEFAESYICPTDIVLGDKFVKKGTWLATLQVNSDELWAGIKNGEFNGLSIGAMASTETIKD